MNILITGAAGFVGKNLTAALECIRDGKDRTHPGLTIGELYLYDLDSPNSLLEEACQKADFVFNLAGVNRPRTQEEFMQGSEYSGPAFFGAHGKIPSLDIFAD